MPIYMKIDGVEGDVTAKGYTGWIEVHSFQWGCSRHLETTTGAAGRRAAGAATVGEVVITKEHDNASGKVFNFAVLGGDGKKVKIDFLHEDNQPYCQYELEETLISSYSQSASGGPNTRPTESMGLNFTKFTYSPQQQQKAGTKASQPDRTVFDLATAAKG